MQNDIHQLLSTLREVRLELEALKRMFFEHRPQFVQDAVRVQVRTTADELRQAADVVAERLGRARGPWTFLVPLQGWSSLDREGKPMYDPAADAAFVARLEEKLAQPERLKKVPLHLYTREFARVAVDELLALIAAAKPETNSQKAQRAVAR